MSFEGSQEGTLAEVARDARLAEGAEGVRRILRTVYRDGPVPLREVARDVSLPVPVVAAVRGELEKRGLLSRAGGLCLTEAGLRRLHEETGIACRVHLLSPAPRDVPPPLHEALDALRKVAAGRPAVDVRLDQSHALPETAVRRAAYLYEHDGLEGRRVLVLGDDDLTSLALALLARSLGLSARSITVLETDERLCAFIGQTAAAMKLPVEVERRDLREPLPDAVPGTQDVFLTDPPYTLEGLGLFVSRGVQALRPEPGKLGFVCFGHRRSAEAAAAFALIAGSGLAPVEIIPDFNDYVGAQMLAGRSQMIRTVFTGAARPTVAGSYRGPLYTADRRTGQGGPAV